MVPTYQRAERVERVVTPLLSDPAVAEVVVVVDGSTDDTMERLQRLAERDPRVRPVWRENAGAAAARQAGIELSRCDVVLLLDDDVLAEPGLASGHLAEHRRQPGRVVIGSMPTRDPQPRRAGDVTTVLYAKAYEHAVQDYRRRPEQVLDAFWSGNVSLPRELALTVGMAAAEGPPLLALEDHDLGLRLRQAGATAVFVPSLGAVHLHARPLDRFAEDSRREGAALTDMHARHPQDVPAPSAAGLAGKLPGPARWLVLASWRSAWLARSAQVVCTVLVRVLGALRWWWAQDAALVVLQRVAHADGAARPRSTGAAGRR